MSERLGSLRTALRGDDSRVGLLTIVGSAAAGLVGLAAVVLAGPAVVSVTGLTASWPPGFVVGASTAAVVCAARARRGGLDPRATALGTGTAAAVFAVLSPGVSLAVGALSPAAGEVLLGGLVEGPDGLFRLSVALAVPAFALGAAVGAVAALADGWV